MPHAMGENVAKQGGRECTTNTEKEHLKEPAEEPKRILKRINLKM